FGGARPGRTWHRPPVPRGALRPPLRPAAHRPRPGPNMVLTIEPMINAGGPEICGLEDKWTAVTVDGTRSAPREHTGRVTGGGSGGGSRNQWLGSGGRRRRAAGEEPDDEPLSGSAAALRAAPPRPGLAIQSLPTPLRPHAPRPARGRQRSGR